MPQPTLTDREVDDDIGQDWKDILERHAADDDDDAPTPGADDATAQGGEQRQQPAGDDAAAAAAAPGADKAGAAEDPARDKNGRFKERRYKEPKQAAAPAKGAQGEDPNRQQQAAADPNAQADHNAQQQQPHPNAQPRDLTKPPSSWRPTARAAWAALPEPVRAEIHRREGDFMAGQAQLVPDARFGAEMARAIEPFRMLIESEGGTPAAAVSDLMKTAAALRTGSVEQKYVTMANIMNRYGLDPRLLVPRQFLAADGRVIPPQPGSQPAQQQFRDPRVDQLLSRMQTDEQQRALADQRNTESVVTRWMNEADAQGNPLRPYVGDVIDEMSALIPSLRAADPTLTHAQALELAYERATWGHPEIRVLLQQQQQTAADARRRSENQQRAASARRGASVNVPRRGALPPRPQTGSMEETIAEEARRLGFISS